MWCSFSGFFMVIVTGLLWIGIGVAVSRCSARGQDYNIVQGLSYLGSVLICLLILYGNRIADGTLQMSGFGFAMCSLAGFATFYNYDFLARAMRQGPNGLIWGIMQSGMIGTILMGVIFFGERPAFLQLLGFFLLLGGVLFIGLSKDRKSSVSGKKWLPFALGALLMCMITQCCNTLPSYFPEMGENGAVSRTLGMYTGGAIGFAVTTIPGMIRNRNFGRRSEWIIAGILTVLRTSANLFFFYKGLDLLAEIGCAGLGYPVANGVCVTGFSLYSLLILKEKVPGLSLLGLGAVCVGLVVIAIH